MRPIRRSQPACNLKAGAGLTCSVLVKCSESLYFRDYELLTVSKSVVECVELDKIISKIEITEAINELKNGKSPGIDQITAEFLKKCLINKSFIELLHTLLNKFFDESIFPSSWAKGIIVPIFKKGERTDPNYYMDITLLSILGKVFTIILNKRITKWTENNKIIAENQAGFRKGYQTSDHIFTLQTLAKQCINMKQAKIICMLCGF